MRPAHVRSAVAGTDFRDLADHPGAAGFHGFANPITRMALVAHLGHDLIVVLGLEQGARLPDIVRQGLLGVHMNTAFHGSQGGREMRMIRC